MWACLFSQSSSNRRRIFETATRISLSMFIRDRYLVLMTAITENPASHKYNVEKGITICSTFFFKAGNLPFNLPGPEMGSEMTPEYEILQ